MLSRAALWQISLLCVVSSRSVTTHKSRSRRREQSSKLRKRLSMLRLTTLSDIAVMCRPPTLQCEGVCCLVCITSCRQYSSTSSRAPSRIRRTCRAISRHWEPRYYHTLGECVPLLRSVLIWYLKKFRIQVKVRFFNRRLVAIRGWLDK